MDHSLHYLIMANQAMVQRALLADLKNTELTIGQPKVLDYLKEHDGVNQKQIAAGCHIEAATLSNVLNNMEKKQMIERKMLHGNRRSLYVFQTDYGRELTGLVDRSFDHVEAKAFSNISAEEQASFLCTFEKIYNNLMED